MFLTNSGNWSETHGLKEKSAKTAQKNRQERFRFDFFFFVILLLIGFAIFRFSKNGSVALPVILLGLGIGVYRYFQNELGHSYKIPRTKIVRVELSADRAAIVFLNEAGQQDSETVEGIENKGIELLQRLFSSAS